MLVQEYEKMLSQKSIIRELAEYSIGRAKEIGKENVFDFSIGNPSEPTPPVVTETLLHLLKTTNPVALHSYCPTLGIPSVREAIAQSLKKRFGLNYTINHIFPTSAAAAAVAHALRCVVTAGQEVIVFAPFFSEYTPYIEGAGGKVVVVPPNKNDFQINFEALEKAITQNTAAVLINTPNNPTGAVYSSKTLTELAALLSKKEQEFSTDIYLISDEPYREMVFSGTESPFVSSFYAKTLMCYSFSKSLSLAGERIGYLAVHPDFPEGEKIVPMCGQISRKIGHNCPSTLMQLAIAQLLDITADFSVYEKNARLLTQGLIDLGLHVPKPEGTFFIFPQVPDTDAIRFSKKAKLYDIIAVPSDPFGVTGHVRLACCLPTEKVERSLHAFKGFLEKEYPHLNKA